MCIRDRYSTVLSKKPEWVTEAHARGIEVNAWTVNSTADMMACIALGVDYITTDNPATVSYTHLDVYKRQPQNT